MRLSDIIKGVDVIEVSGDAGVDVNDIVYSSSDVRSGSCFVAVRGHSADGHDFVADAISKGALAVVREYGGKLPAGVTDVLVLNSREAMAFMSSKFFRDPSMGLKLVGVTGTNGKTTITYLIESIFKKAGEKTGVVGTIHYRFGDVTERARHTTPESIDLQRLLFGMKEAGVGVCAMEVSSHALAQDRVLGCHFDAAIFTNLTPEHLDYHADMEGYFASKALLFERLLAESKKRDAFAVINGDDLYGRKLIEVCPVPVCLYGLGENGNVVGKDLKFDSGGLRMKIETPAGSFNCRSKLRGRFNAMNILASVAVADRMGVAADVVIEAIDDVDVVPGRFESIPNDLGILALIDYAHTPDALENVLGHARELLGSKGARLIVVFGCGGDRDRTKRPLMGRVAGRLADVSLVTSDNPRTEDPKAIIDEIEPGVRETTGPLKNGRGYEIIVDRRAAIARAIDIAYAGDIVLVAGKGHEDYQIIGKRQIHFDDREVIGECMRGKR